MNLTTKRKMAVAKAIERMSGRDLNDFVTAIAQTNQEGSFLTSRTAIQFRILRFAEVHSDSDGEE